MKFSPLFAALFLPLPLPLILSSCASLGVGKNDFSVTFHLESDRPQGNSTFTDQVGDPPRDVLFFILPLFDHTDIAAVQPFPMPNADGSYGATFQFKPAATRRLLTTSAAKQGLYIRSLVHGVPVDYLLIDRQITDGRIVIWRGISEEFLNILTSRFPPINR